MKLCSEVNVSSNLHNGSGTVLESGFDKWLEQKSTISERAAFIFHLLYFTIKKV